MLAAIVTCGMGYAVGGKLTEPAGQPGGHLLGAGAVAAGVGGSPPSRYGRRTWRRRRHRPGSGFAYVSVFSMFVGFLFWYRGLALGGAARVGQLQLLQTFAGLGLAALLLGEAVAWGTWAVAAGVALSVFAARRTA